MTERTVITSTFEIERAYPVPPARVFAAWADPVAKARWFTGAGVEKHELDFRPGGRELVLARQGSGVLVTFEAWYRDIVDGERIVFTSTLSHEDTVATVALTTVRFRAADEGTELLLTEQGSFLDGHEQPAWREQGTNDWLTALGEELRR